MKNWIGKTGTFGTYKINHRFIKIEQTGGKEAAGRRNQSKNSFGAETWAKLGESDKKYIADRTAEDGTVSLADLVKIRQLVERLG